MKNDELKFLLDIAILLIGANIGGMLMAKINQPVVLGQILAGLIIGPALFDIVSPNEIINSFSQIGVILLMFIAGMETDLNDLKNSAGASSFIALGGIIFPFFGGLGITLLLFPDGGLYQGLFTGTLLTATSISITVQVLREFDKIRTKTGISNLGAAIMDDVLGIIILTVIVGMAFPNNGESTVLVIVKIFVFLVIALFAGKLFTSFINKISYKFFRNRNVAEFALILCFLLAFTAEEFGVAAIIGAYFTGVVFSITPFASRVEKDISSIAYTLFTPIFFISIGLKVSLEGIGDIILPALAIMGVAVFGKVIGSGLGAKISGFNAKDSLRIGIGMIPRAEVALIIANLGRSLGLINDVIFTSSVLMVVVSTLITPPLLKKAYGVEKTKNLNIVKEK
ncbi:MAG: cation:proton antiporter [Bacillota bacterium]|nr:cation:proton antiporter [Bacillota bacterium]